LAHGQRNPSSSTMNKTALILFSGNDRGHESLTLNAQIMRSYYAA
jgi:hypothetical protein